VRLEVGSGEMLVIELGGGIKDLVSILLAIRLDTSLGMDKFLVRTMLIVNAQFNLHTPKNVWTTDSGSVGSSPPSPALLQPWQSIFSQRLSRLQRSYASHTTIAMFHQLDSLYTFRNAFFFPKRKAIAVSLISLVYSPGCSVTMSDGSGSRMSLA